MADKPQGPSEEQLFYFDFLAEIGMTKHIGSLKATDEMLELAQIKAGDHILDVGVGVGKTPPYIIKKYGVTVAGIDITPRMIERSIQVAKQTGIADKTEYKVADAQDIPYPDETFDIVMVESVCAFIPDLPRAMREFKRVLKPGGYLAMNESTWINAPDEVMNQVMDGIGANPKTPEEWEGSMRDAGFEDIVARSYLPNMKEEARGRLKRLGCMGIVVTMFRSIFVLIKNSKMRKFIKESASAAPKAIQEYMGYGVYVGRKPAA